MVAAALAITRRHLRRLVRRYELRGAAGLIHGNRGRPSPRRLSEPVRARVTALLRHPEARLNDCHLADLVRDEGFEVSPASVRRLRGELGLPAKRARRPRLHRRRREREACRGSLVLLDGSQFAWLDDQQPQTALVGALDDATGHILALSFRPHEDLHGYAEVLRTMGSRYGLPLAVYGDRTGILRRNDHYWTIEEELAGRQRPTQAGRILEELHVRYIPAQSPQAKGRIERLWNTLQDRFVAELRLRGLRTLDQATAFLPRFIERYNQRFGRPPRQARSVWRSPPRHFDRLLACCYSRQVAADNVVSIPGRWIQVPPGPRRRSYHGCRVEVRELLDGRLLVFHDGQLIAEQPSPPGSFTLIPRGPSRRRQATDRERPRPTPRGEEATRPPRRTLPPTRPSATHPWRRSYDPNLLPAPGGQRGT